MNPDFEEMLAALSAAGARFLVVEAHAVAAYATPRATGDIDIWIGASTENAAKVWGALLDILTSIEGVVFDDAWKRREMLDVAGIAVPIIAREDLITNKRALARPRDLADLADLEKSR